MPRTKRPVNRKETVEDLEKIKKLDMLLAELKDNIDRRVEETIGEIEWAFKIVVDGLKTNVLNKTVRELKSELLLNKVQSSSKPVSHGSTISHSSHTASSYDDGYLTENSSQGSWDRRHTKKMVPPSTGGRAPLRRSRSADPRRPAAPPTAAKTSSRRRSQSVYRTPAYKATAAAGNYPVITPKVTPHTPLTLLRQPRLGEMVVSMSGSPVMVPTYNNMHQDEKANCNILLEDGTMLSLQPKQLRQSQAYIPFSLMNEKTLEQMKIIKENLDKVLQIAHVKK